MRATQIIYLSLAALWVIVTAAPVSGQGAPGPTPSGTPVRLTAGPHLFLDEYLIEASWNVSRQVNRPQRDLGIPNPIITGQEDHCFQPYISVVRDPQTGRFRMWYGAYGPERKPTQGHLGYVESDDGIHWKKPHRVLEDPAPLRFGASVIDEGPDLPDPAKRFKYAWWNDGGLKIAASPDGLVWKPMFDEVVLHHNHDINNIFRDPIRDRYMATVSMYITGKTWSGQRRVTLHSTSKDLLGWEKPWFVLTPDDNIDPGETQFYAMNGYLARGDLLIGLVKVLRDDLKADDPPDPPNAYGIGYTTLAWTRDGRHWTRDREVFFDRNPKPKTWDHAHAWISVQLPMGDEVYLYYGGYARGHKVGRFEERQIGVVRMKRDRYVARVAGPCGGHFQTRVVTLDASLMTVNVNAGAGELRVRILDADRKPIPGFTFADCRPIRRDALAAPVEWKRHLTDLKNTPARLEFALRNARLFAFDLQDSK